jgi:tetratricopeptide (TPR) repeat protein
MFLFACLLLPTIILNAGENYERALALSNAQFAYENGMRSFRRGDLHFAQEYLGIAIQGDSNNYQYQLSLTEVWKELKKYDRALKKCDHIILSIQTKAIKRLGAGRGSLETLRIYLEAKHLSHEILKTQSKEKGSLVKEVDEGTKDTLLNLYEAYIWIGGIPIRSLSEKWNKRFGMQKGARDASFFALIQSPKEAKLRSHLRPL